MAMVPCMLPELNASAWHVCQVKRHEAAAGSCVPPGVQQASHDGDYVGTWQT